MGDGISTRDSDSTRSAARCASIISAGLARNAVVWLAFLAVAGCVSAELAAQDRVLLASSSQPTYQIGERRPELLRAGPVGDPFVVEAPIAEGRRENVCFRAAGDEECFPLGVSEAVSLRIEQGGTHRNVRVVGVLHVPAARFSPEYQAANRGRFQVLLPEVYELVNIGIALTDYAAANPGLVATDTDYYSRAWAHFEPYRGHPFVQALSRGMQEDVFWYFRYKMNAFAFEFDAEGQIVRSVIYDRTGFYDEQTNDLLPLLTMLQDFAQDTDFRSFYQQNRPFYDEQVAFFETDAGCHDDVDVAHGALSQRSSLRWRQGCLFAVGWAKPIRDVDRRRRLSRASAAHQFPLHAASGTECASCRDRAFGDIVH